jgi:hypothetical protein
MLRCRFSLMLLPIYVALWLFTTVVSMECYRTVVSTRDIDLVSLLMAQLYFSSEHSTRLAFVRSVTMMYCFVCSISDRLSLANNGTSRLAPWSIRAVDFIDQIQIGHSPCYPPTERYLLFASNTKLYLLLAVQSSPKLPRLARQRQGLCSHLYAFLRDVATETIVVNIPISTSMMHLVPGVYSHVSGTKDWIDATRVD